MNLSRLLRLALVVLIVPAVAVVTARAGDPAADSQALSKRISADIAAELPHAGGAPAPSTLTSHPAALRTKHAPAPAASAAAASVEPAPAPPDSTPDGAWSDLLAGNRRFAADHPRAQRFARARDSLATDPHPHAIVLGCADSGVGPELVFDQAPGDLFVVRTAGNIVDPIALGSLEYAVEHLHAHLLVVLGHTSCGAVEAAAAGDSMPSSYLQAIVDRIRPTVQRLANCFEGDELVQRSVIANARQSATDIVSNSALLRAAVSRGELKVVSAVYDQRTGVVTPVSAPAATAAAQAPAR